MSAVPKAEVSIASAGSMCLLPLGRVMGIDYGTRRVGISMSDPSQTIASPLTTLEYRRETDLVHALLDLVRIHEVIAIVVGWPLNMNGVVGDKTAAVERFIKTISEQIDLPVFSWDERWSTVSAHRALREWGISPSKNKARVDAIAGALILDAFLQRLRLLRQTQQTSG